MGLKLKIKLAIALLILGLLSAFLFLNRQSVEVDLILASVEMSRAVMILGVFGSGFLFGWILHSVFRVRLPRGND